MSAQAQELIKVWPDGAPNTNGLIVEQRTDDPNWIVDIPEATLTVYPAASPNGKMVMMCPGGGYMGLAVGHEGHNMAEWFNERGVGYAVLEYRLPNGHSDIPLEDAAEAMRILRRNAERWGVDKGAIGIAGASAGGHLAATLSTIYPDSMSRPDFSILFYPVVTMTETTHSGSRENLLGKNPSQDEIRLFSAEMNVDSLTPRAFVMLSADDDAVPTANSFNYVSALISSGVPAEMHLYPTGGHGWGFNDSFIYKPLWTAELDAWLRSF